MIPVKKHTARLALSVLASVAAMSTPMLTHASETASDKSLTQSVRDGARSVGDSIQDGTRAVGDYASDASITGMVKTAFVANETVKALDINVDTNDGVVTLKGAVATPEESATAERVAADVAGVRKVDNQLTLKTNR